MPEGYPTQESQVPYYEAVKDQGAENTPSDPSRLALRRIHYIESPSDRRTPSNHQEVKPGRDLPVQGTKQYLEPMPHVMLLDLT